MPTDADEPADGDPGEDDFDRELRKLTTGESPAPFREPSAAERARQAAPARRKRKPGRDRRRRAPSRLTMAGIGITVLACVAAAFAATALAHHQAARPRQVPSGASAPSSAGASSPATAAAAATAATVADPFAGSPAAAFADGRAAIVPPRGHATGEFSAAQTRAAYRTTRALLIARGLNRPTLRGDRPAAFAKLLVPQERTSFLRGLDKTGLTRHHLERSTRTWISSFAPGSATLDGSVIKVHGRMTASQIRVSGRAELQVHADYLFVYPVFRPGEPSTLVRVVARVVVDVQFAQWDDPGGPLEPWWDQRSYAAAGVLCTNDGYFRPDYDTAAPQKVQPSGSPVNPYDQGRTPTTLGCRKSTGT